MNKLICPQCGSSEIYIDNDYEEDGIMYEVYICDDCGEWTVIEIMDDL
jgi:predicted RNA-binding Zn-ribbon protein involved in translation (DUF1610 family)